jgi:protein gp37
MKNSKIEWTHHTFNPWIGCTKVDDLCTNCYAEVTTFVNALRKQGHELWGKGKPRHRTSADYWKEPLNWNATAGNSRIIDNTVFVHFGETEIVGKPASLRFNCYSIPPGGKRKDAIWRAFTPSEWEALPKFRPRVFCASLADWLDDEAPKLWLYDLMDLIQITPNLDWLLLTKRPENFYPRLRDCMSGHPFDRADDFICNWLRGEAPKNVWIGASVGTQKSADERIPQLSSIPAQIRFLSCEPLLAYTDIIRQTNPNCFDWVICGGESGPNARPMHPFWASNLRDQCQVAGVPFFFKQWGEWAPRCGSLDCIQSGTDFADLDPNCEKWPRVIRLGEHGKNTRILENCGNSGEEIYMQCVGKKRAGRILNGREWNELPEPFK